MYHVRGRAPLAPLFRSVARILTVLLGASTAGCGLPGVPPLPPAGPEAEPGGIPIADENLVLEPDSIPGDCFARHLREAISINERRRPVYSAWTDGASEPISRRLIAGERRALWVAGMVDGRAEPFHEAGIPIVCAEFVSMSLVPPLDAAPGPPDHDPPPAPDPRALLDALSRAYAAGGFTGMARAAAAEVRALEAAPAYRCMTRHLLESIARAAALAPVHEARARDAGLHSPRPLSELMLRLHLAVLPDAAELDRAAAPLQAAGVPILCRDVPPIPYPSPR